MSGTPWMPEAWKRLGQAEIAGDGNNPEIVSWWRIIGLPGVKNDRTPNCAAFGLAMLVLGGVSIDSMPLKDRGAAIAFEAFGAPSEMREGAIVVTRRHEDGNPRARHMGFLLSWTQDSVTLLNANVGDKVCVATFPRADVTAVRWPEFTDTTFSDAAVTDVTPAPPQAKPEPAAADATRAALNHPIGTLLAISRTIRGALWSFLGGLVLLFQETLHFIIDTYAKVQELAPVKGLLLEAGANLKSIGFACVAWGVVWVAAAKLTPKPAPEPKA
jgi:hypothetical protein